MAYLSKDTKTIEAIKSGKDLHKIAAAALYQISTDEVTKLQRQNGKIFRFAAAYGAKEDKIAEQFGISKAEAKKLINNYFNEYPALLEFQQSTFLETLNRGYILVDKLGRRSYLPNWEEYLATKSKRLYAEYYRLNANFQIQGTAASMSKFALILLREQLKNTTAKIVGFVHDEIIVECNLNEATKIKKILERCMNKASAYFGGGISKGDALITNN